VLNLQIVRGPLGEQENEAILREYNRLTSSCIPGNEFAHWVQKSPAGPAWHAMLKTDEGRIVGHTSLFPLRTGYAEAKLVPAKSEYSFLHEDFRSQKIRGSEKVAKPPFIIILDQLFQHCIREGWGPIFASTREKNQVFTRRVGLRSLEFPLWECLLVLRPNQASRHTPNLTPGQRTALWSAGMLQCVPWIVAGMILSHSNGVRVVPVAEGQVRQQGDRLSFFEDPASLAWRYFDGQYVRLSLDSGSSDYVIAKRGSAQRYFRVCQWDFDSANPVFPVINALVKEARKQRAMGVRWAVYDNGAQAMKIVRQMRNAGFVCRQRMRTMMIHNQNPEFLETSRWNMNDSLVSFDP
jgi:hypothetical protein